MQFCVSSKPPLGHKALMGLMPFLINKREHHVQDTICSNSSHISSFSFCYSKCWPRKNNREKRTVSCRRLQYAGDPPCFAEAVSVNRTVFKESKDAHIVEYINNSISLDKTVTIEDVKVFRSSCKPSILMESLASRYENTIDPFVFDQKNQLHNSHKRVTKT